MKNPMRILCVDDEANVLRSLRRLFIDNDYEMFTAVSAKEGLDILDSTDEVQVVVSDYRMPGMDGVEFMSEVCRKWPDTIRIVLSGYADTAAVVEAINVGRIYKFIPKPWNDDQLLVTIQKAFETYDLKKKNAQLMDKLKCANDQLRGINDSLGEAVEMNFLQAFRQQTQKIYFNILSAFPMGVIAFDEQGYVKHVNPTAKSMFQSLNKASLNGTWDKALPKALHPYMKKLLSKGAVTEPFSLGDRQGWVMGKRFKVEGQENMLLAFDTQDPDSV